MAVRATLTIAVKDGREQDFEAAWRAVAEVVRANPDSLRQALARDRDDPRVYVVTSDWRSAEAFAAFEKSPQQDALTAPIRDLRESARMTVHELLVCVEGEP